MKLFVVEQEDGGVPRASFHSKEEAEKYARTWAGNIFEEDIALKDPEDDFCLIDEAEDILVAYNEYFLEHRESCVITITEVDSPSLREGEGE